MDYPPTSIVIKIKYQKKEIKFNVHRACNDTSFLIRFQIFQTNSLKTRFQIHDVERNYAKTIQTVQC